jgi:hypothetical protein
LCVTQNKAAFFISHHTWEPSKKRRKDSDFLFIVQLFTGSFSGDPSLSAAQQPIISQQTFFFSNFLQVNSKKITTFAVRM